MITFLAIVVVALGTYFARSIFILVLADRKIPDPVLVSLQFVAPAVLAALVIALLIDETGNVTLGVPEFSAFVAGGAVAYRTRNHIWTLLAGMAVYWAVRALL